MLRAAAILSLIVAVAATAFLWRQAANPHDGPPLALPAPPLGNAPGSVVVIPGAPPPVLRRGRRGGVRIAVPPARTGRTSAPTPPATVAPRPVGTPAPSRPPTPPKPTVPPKSPPPTPPTTPTPSPTP